MGNNSYKNVLFINYGGIGDEILFLPAIIAFKKCFPEAKITLCLEDRAKGIKTLTDVIDETISVDIKAKGFKKYLNVLKLIFEVRKKGFDLVISSGKSPFVAIILYLMGIKTKIGYKTKTSSLLDYQIPLNEECYAGNMYYDLVAPIVEAEFSYPTLLYDKEFKLPDGVNEGEFILIHPGVSLMSKKKNILKCPDTAFWIETIKGILAKNKKVILAGGVDDEEIVYDILKNEEIRNNENFYSFFKKTKSLYEMAGLIKKAECIICVDSAPMHLAVGLNSNIIALFGPTNERKLIPQKNNIKVVMKEIECRPCLWNKRLTSCEKPCCIEFQADDILNFVK